MGYKPTYIKGYEQGLVQSRIDFILPNGAFPILQNAYVWRERIKRKQGSQLLGRLRRRLLDSDAGECTTVIGSDVFNVFDALGLSIDEPNAELQLPTITPISITFDAPISQTISTVTNDGTMIVMGAGPIVAPLS